MESMTVLYSITFPYKHSVKKDVKITQRKHKIIHFNNTPSYH